MTLHLTGEAEQLARLLAIKTGKDLDTIVKEALEDRARVAGVAVTMTRRPVDRAAVQAIIARVSALPILDDRSADAIIDYDEFGVPR